MVKGDFEVCVTTLSAVALLEDENLWRSWQIFEKGTPPATFFFIIVARQTMAFHDARKNPDGDKCSP